MISGLSEIFKSSPGELGQKFTTFGDVLTALFSLILYIGGFLMVFWLFWGVFEYIFSGGEKEKLGRAQKRITWAIFGFIFIILSFLISDYIKDVFWQASGPRQIRGITPP